MPNNFTLTQFPGNLGTETNTVVIGLDFGTSSSKVVLNNNSARKAFAINFGDQGHLSNRYLLPTRPYFDLQGKFKLSPVSGFIPLRELKSFLVGNRVSGLDYVAEEQRASAEVLAVAYLARTLQIARSWYLSTQREAFGHARIEWQLNLGIPAVGNAFDEKKAMFNKLAKAAWIASCELAEITSAGVADIIAQTTDLRLNNSDIHSDNINVIPEIVAEILGYSRSSARRNGLHILVDIGAGTLDITSVNLHSDNGEDRYPILTGDVKWLGGFELHKHKIDTIRNEVANWLGRFGKNEDPVQPLPTKNDNYLPTLVQLGLDDTRSLDREFYRKCKSAIHETLHYLRKRKYPNAPEWTTGITCFICGGGKNITFYSEAVMEVDTWLRDNGRSAGLIVEELPAPDNLDIGGLKEAEYHRIAVAYGLSFPHYDVGKIIPPSEIEDVPSADHADDYRDKYVGKEQV